jgi:hypothetical protein
MFYWVTILREKDTDNLPMLHYVLYSFSVINWKGILVVLLCCISTIYVPFTTLIQVLYAQQGNAHREGLNLNSEYSLAFYTTVTLIMYLTLTFRLTWRQSIPNRCLRHVGRVLCDKGYEQWNTSLLCHQWAWTMSGMWKVLRWTNDVPTHTF